MTENSNDHTQPVEGEKPERLKKKFLEKRSSWFLLGIFVMVLFILIGMLLGVPRGINDRVKLAEAQAGPKVQAQLESAKLDIEEGRYQVALDRLDWILDEMSPYLDDEVLAEVGDLYSKTLLQLTSIGAAAAMPSPTPTQPEHTPTPDLRGEEELYTTAQQQLAAEAWNEVIQTLETLRQKNLSYKPIQVDGMLYVALRNRGLQKILAEGSLEPGIYDLTLAERFAPLDSSAEGIRTWTRYYLTGASYWGVDWAQVVFYFEQVYPMLPNLRDGTFMTTTERFRLGAIEYAKQLADAEEYCLAQEYFEKAMAIQADPLVQPLANEVADKCYQINNPPVQEQPADPTPGPTGTPVVAPTEGPTEVPTEEPTEEPTATPAE